MSLAPWRSPLARALHRNRSLAHARYLQLATVRADGRPANRTIVFRGFLDPTNQLKFVTDARNEKAEQIDQTPWAEVCWYFPNSREQFRLLGRLTLVRETHPEAMLVQARQQAWQALSESARVQFAWPHPGKQRASAEAFSPAPPDPQLPLPHFCLLLLEPIQVDHLELKGEPQNRRRHIWGDDRNWTTQEINP